jgi:hypothetical protein
VELFYLLLERLDPRYLLPVALFCLLISSVQLQRLLRKAGDEQGYRIGHLV